MEEHEYIYPGTKQSLQVVQVVAGCVWVAEERIWAPEVFIVGEGIHFIVGDLVRLMATPNRANIIAAERGIKMSGRQGEGGKWFACGGG